MRLLVITVGAPYGPAEAFAAPELRSLRNHGHDITLAPIRPRGTIVHREFETAVDSLLVAPLLSPGVVGGAIAEAIRSPRSVATVIVLLAKSRSLGTLAKNLAVLPKALWLGRHARQADIEHIHAYWATTPATVGIIAAATARIGFSLTAHAADIDADNLLVAKSQRASVLRVISRDGERKVLEAGVSPGVVRLVRLGVEVPRLVAPASRLQGPFVVLVPAALHPMKGHTYLLEALRLVMTSSPHIHIQLQLAGSGPLEGELRRRSEELGIGHLVTFLGQLAHDDLLARYRDASVDVVALASVSEPGRMAAEGIPVSLIEALAHGIPVVAADSGGVSELVDETNGVLVSMRDPGALADAFRMLALDPGLARRLGAAGRERVQAEYDVRRTVVDLVGAMTQQPGTQGFTTSDHR